MKKLFIHDLETSVFETLMPPDGEERQVIDDNGSILPCNGCFGCWIKTPGKCVLKDGYENMGADLAQADEVVIISRCCYGGYSPFVKNVLDRSISYMLPFFEIVDDEAHHQKRYEHEFKFSVYFYGENLSDEEKRVAEAMVKSNCVNLQVKDSSVSFLEVPVQKKEVLV